MDIIGSYHREQRRIISLMRHNVEQGVPAVVRTIQCVVTLSIEFMLFTKVARKTIFSGRFALFQRPRLRSLDSPQWTGRNSITTRDSSSVRPLMKPILKFLHTY